MRILSTFLVAVLSGSAAMAAEGGAFPPFDSSKFAGQLFWLMITFGLLYLLMSRIALPRVGAVLEARAQAIDSALKAADTAQKAAENDAKTLEASLANARAEAQKLGQSARDASAAQVEAQRKTVEADLAKRVEAAEANIRDMRNKALAHVGAIAGETATAILTQITGKAPAAGAVDAVLAKMRKA